jgi:hypothetical protein
MVTEQNNQQKESCNTISLILSQVKDEETKCFCGIFILGPTDIMNEGYREMNEVPNPQGFPSKNSLIHLPENVSFDNATDFLKNCFEHITKQIIL